MDNGTRRRILDALKWHGGQSAGQMAESMGLTAMAVRQHLYALAEEGLVQSTEVPGAVGRPSKIWELTDGAEAFFPQGYADLTAGLLVAMRDALGQDGVDKVVETRLKQQTASYSSEMVNADTLANRLQTLVKIRTAEGYMAALEEDDQGYLFVENHCPICAAAKACTGLCAAELTLFKAVLGPDVSIERTDHILAGARRCAYRITLGS